MIPLTPTNHPRQKKKKKKQTPTFPPLQMLGRKKKTKQETSQDKVEYKSSKHLFLRKH